MNKKVVIIGAGPIGCYLGQLLKEKGLNSVLIEDHKEIGRPIHCAGLVGKKVFAEAKIPISSNCILNTINGAIINLEKDEFILKKPNVAYVVDRERFDKNLGKDLDILFETKFLGVEKKDGSYLVETDKGDLEADIVVGADGANSSVREFVNGNHHLEYLKGVQFRMKCKPEFKDLVRVYIEKPYFYWVIPECKNIVRIGTLSKNPYYDLLEFIKKKRIEGEILEKFAGTVPLTHFKTLSRERVFLVGDSASQIKPLTYGGIYMGMRGAEILSECIINENFSEYSYLWAKRFGREARISLRAREIFQKLSEEDIKKIFTFAKKNTRIIEEKGDFENHSSLVWEFLRNWSNSRELADIFLKIFKANFKK